MVRKTKLLLKYCIDILLYKNTLTDCILSFYQYKNIRLKYLHMTHLTFTFPGKIVASLLISVDRAICTDTCCLTQLFE